MESRSFVDTNVFVYHLLGDHSAHSPASSEFFGRIRAGEFQAWTSETVIFETVFTLQRKHHVPRGMIAETVRELVSLPGILCRDKDLLLETLDLWVRETPLSFADCYHLLYARHIGLTQIYTFDRKMGRIPGVARVEP
ncbi:MAG: PIN domain-containing protein [Thermomicrobiales bacterium]